MRARIAISFLIWLVLWLPMAVIGVPAVLLGMRYAIDKPHMPAIFWPWDNFNDGVHGMGYAGYWGGVWWSAFRNPCSNWGKLALGIKPPGSLIVDGNQSIRDNPKPGHYIARAGWAWEYYYVIPWGASHYIRVRIGWKLAGATIDKASFVFSISPFRKFR